MRNLLEHLVIIEMYDAEEQQKCMKRIIYVCTGHMPKVFYKKKKEIKINQNKVYKSFTTTLFTLPLKMCTFFLSRSSVCILCNASELSSRLSIIYFREQCKNVY